MSERRKYEMVSILAPGSGESIETVKNNIESTLTKREAVITGFEDLGQQKMFHLTRKHERGHFLFHTFEAVPEAITQITSDMKIHQTVIKNMVSRA